LMLIAFFVPAPVFMMVWCLANLQTYYLIFPVFDLLLSVFYFVGRSKAYFTSVQSLPKHCDQKNVATRCNQVIAVKPQPKLGLVQGFRNPKKESGVINIGWGKYC
jgi:hypothetical protein